MTAMKSIITQSQRAIRTRYCEHSAQIKYDRKESSSGAENLINFAHSVETKLWKFVKHVIDKRLLNALES